MGRQEGRVIGLALKEEKHRRHISQALLDKARAAGFQLKVLDPRVPLEQQGPLDAVLQKLRQPGAVRCGAGRGGRGATRGCSSLSCSQHAFR